MTANGSNTLDHPFGECLRARDKLVQELVSERIGKRSGVPQGIRQIQMSAPTHFEAQSDESKLLVDLLVQHAALISSANSLEEINDSFRPLLLARCLFNFDGPKLKRRAPSKIARTIASEEKHGWRSFAWPHGTHGRPSGKASTPAGQFLEAVICALTEGMTLAQCKRVESWLLAPGCAPEPCSGHRGKPPDGRAALIEALTSEMRDNGANPNEIRTKVRDLRTAIDNRCRNRRARKK